MDVTRALEHLRMHGAGTGNLSFVLTPEIDRA